MPILREFEATVEKTDGCRVLLDVTAFYPRPVGQPSDLGVIRKGETGYQVSCAELAGEEIRHILDREGLSPGDRVRGQIDWERRYRFMPSRTACHILSAVIFWKTGARITGNQIDLFRPAAGPT